jgi:glycosyltransferase involved in cell wall biosynthesis
MSVPQRVTVIVPCRNERAFIERSLYSIVASDYPTEYMEVLVVDGMSDDGTREILAELAEGHPVVRVLDNPNRITPSALNIGIRQATGSVIVRMDAHNWYPPSYISSLVDRLETSGADNVGGVWKTCPANDSPRARAIAMAQAHPLGVGNAHYRIGSNALRWVDTVPFGCYRRDVFDRIGLFAEELVRNQDDEFNHRLIRNGGRILLDPQVESHYFARESIGALGRMYYQYGYFKPLVARKIGAIMTVRQLIPALFVSWLVIGVALSPFSEIARWGVALTVLAYLGAVAVAMIAAAGRAGLRAALWLFVAFPAIHLSYGIGFLRGVGDFWVRRRRSVPRAEDFAITR